MCLPKGLKQCIQIVVAYSKSQHCNQRNLPVKALQQDRTRCRAQQSAHQTGQLKKHSSTYLGINKQCHLQLQECAHLKQIVGEIMGILQQMASKDNAPHAPVSNTSSRSYKMSLSFRILLHTMRRVGSTQCLPVGWRHSVFRQCSICSNVFGTVDRNPFENAKDTVPPKKGHMAFIQDFSSNIYIT